MQTNTGVIIIDVCDFYLSETWMPEENIQKFLVNMYNFLTEKIFSSTIVVVNDNAGPIESLENLYGEFNGYPEKIVDLVSPFFRFYKDDWDCFLEEGLVCFLEYHNIETVYLCGLYSEFCVYASFHGALQRGFIPIAVESACLMESGDVGITQDLVNSMEKRVMSGIA